MAKKKVLSRMNRRLLEHNLKNVILNVLNEAMGSEEPVTPQNIGNFDPGYETFGPYGADTPGEFAFILHLTPGGSYDARVFADADTSSLAYELIQGGAKLTPLSKSEIEVSFDDAAQAEKWRETIYEALGGWRGGGASDIIVQQVSRHVAGVTPVRRR